MKKEQSQKGQQKRRRNLSEFEGNDIRHESIVYVKSKRKNTLRKKSHLSDKLGDNRYCDKSDLTFLIRHFTSYNHWL